MNSELKAGNHQWGVVNWECGGATWVVGGVALDSLPDGVQSEFRRLVLENERLGSLVESATGVVAGAAAAAHTCE